MARATWKRTVRRPGGFDDASQWPMWQAGYEFKSDDYNDNVVYDDNGFIHRREHLELVELKRAV